MSYDDSDGFGGGSYESTTNEANAAAEAGSQGGDYTPSAQEIADFQAALDALNNTGTPTGIATGGAAIDYSQGMPTGQSQFGNFTIGPNGEISLTNNGRSAGGSVYDFSGGDPFAGYQSDGPGDIPGGSGAPLDLNRFFTGSTMGRNLLEQFPIIGNMIRGGNLLNDFATRNGLSVQYGGPNGANGGGAGDWRNLAGGGAAGGAGAGGALGGSVGGLLGSGGSGGFSGFQNAGPFLGDPNYRSYGISY